MEPPPTTQIQLWDTKYNEEELTYTTEKAEYYASQGIWKLLQKYLKPQGQYVDVGCGMGTWILFLKEKGYQEGGCDITPQTIQRLQHYDSSLQVRVASILNLPYANESLDGILTIGVLEYLHKQTSEAMLEVNRVIKSGGIFFIEVPSRNILRVLFYFPVRRLNSVLKFKKEEITVRTHYFFSRHEIKKLLEKNDFVVVEMVPHEMPHPKCHFGLYNDWAFLRGKKPKHLNTLGLFLKYVFNSISPWVAATGILIVAIKK